MQVPPRSLVQERVLSAPRAQPAPRATSFRAAGAISRSTVGDVMVLDRRRWWWNISRLHFSGRRRGNDGGLHLDGRRGQRIAGLGLRNRRRLALDRRRRDSLERCRRWNDIARADRDGWCDFSFDRRWRRGRYVGFVDHLRRVEIQTGQRLHGGRCDRRCRVRGRWRNFGRRSRALRHTYARCRQRRNGLRWTRQITGSAVRASCYPRAAGAPFRAKRYRRQGPT